MKAMINALTTYNSHASMNTIQKDTVESKEQIKTEVVTPTSTADTVTISDKAMKSLSGDQNGTKPK